MYVPPPSPAEGKQDSDDNWPDPSPWTGIEQETNNSMVTKPVLSMLEKMMADLQVIKDRATGHQTPLISTAKNSAPQYGGDLIVQHPQTSLEHVNDRQQLQFNPQKVEPAEQS